MPSSGRLANQQAGGEEVGGSTQLSTPHCSGAAQEVVKEVHGLPLPPQHPDGMVMGPQLERSVDVPRWCHLGCYH